MSQKPEMGHLPLWRSIAVGGAVIALASACASTPPAPTADLQSAAQAIATADQARIPDTTAPELAEARDKLAAAQAAVAVQHMQEADRLALESRADAELASATSQASKDQSINDEIVQSTATLSQEMQRNKGTNQ
jgi:putative cell wall-binding protein